MSAPPAASADVASASSVGAGAAEAGAAAGAAVGADSTGAATGAGGVTVTLETTGPAHPQAAPAKRRKRTASIYHGASPGPTLPIGSPPRGRDGLPALSADRSRRDQREAAPSRWRIAVSSPGVMSRYSTTRP